MGKPRLIVLIRHAQSEGNKNRDIHQVVPDHRVKLTDEGWKQAEDAGRRLKTLLKPDDTLQIFTSPYRRTRETTEGLLRTLTAQQSFDPSDPDYESAPSPLSRQKIKVWEEPRLREQDFGNFQPCSAEMERMWQERADYGHFFYRIPNGESAADAYDRVSGFNESLWRQFGDVDFPSVCVLVTHGLMTRVFLMKWYHWSVEYFEDLRNINHCEFITMKQNPTSGKYVLETQLRTWSELKRQKAAEAVIEENPQRRNTLSSFLSQTHESPGIPPRKWGGCVGGCDHNHDQFPRRTQKLPDVNLPPTAEEHDTRAIQNDSSRHPQPPTSSADYDQSTPTPTNHNSSNLPTISGGDSTLDPPEDADHALTHRPRAPSYLKPGLDGGGETPGAQTPQELSDEEGYFSHPSSSKSGTKSRERAPHELKSIAAVMLRRRKQERKPTPEDVERWASESGMGRGRMADGLGDVDEPDEVEEADEVREEGRGESALEEAERRDKSLRGSVY